MLGWPEVAPFERIIVTAAAGQTVPKALLDQLAEDGIMILPMGGDKASQFIVKVTRRDGEFFSQQLWPTRFVPLLPGDPGAESEPDDPLAALYKDIPKLEELR